MISNHQFLLELLGYLASALVAVSLMMKSILRLRIINSLGAFCFTVYGMLIGAYPVAAVNFVILLINGFFLYQMVVSREYFTLLDVAPNSDYLKSFLQFYGPDLRQYSPQFLYRPTPRHVHTFVLRNMVPAGLVIGELREDGTFCIDLDYATASYRDFKIGDFLFGKQSEFLRQKGIRRMQSTAGSHIHAQYLKRMGFAPDPADASGRTFFRDVR